MTQPQTDTGRDTPDAAQASDRRDADRPLSDSKLGDQGSGGLAGQGGMRDPEKTSEPGAFKPS